MLEKDVRAPHNGPGCGRKWCGHERPVAVNVTLDAARGYGWHYRSGRKAQVQQPGGAGHGALRLSLTNQKLEMV
jgi:hypothetical protein